jgi:hypothetical protein
LIQWTCNLGLHAQNTFHTSTFHQDISRRRSNGNITKKKGILSLEVERLHIATPSFFLFNRASFVLFSSLFFKKELPNLSYFTSFLFCGRAKSFSHVSFYGLNFSSQSSIAYSCHQEILHMARNQSSICIVACFLFLLDQASYVEKIF